MDPNCIADSLRQAHAFFNRSTSSLTEDDSTYAPVDGLFTAAQMVAHVAHTVDWFFEGAFRSEGFDLDMETLTGASMGYTSLTAARAWIDRAFPRACEIALSKSREDWAEALPEGPVMGGAPRFAIIAAIEDHTAHHRGALAVYARLRGRTPPMPYMDAES